MACLMAAAVGIIVAGRSGGSADADTVAGRTGTAVTAVPAATGPVRYPTMDLRTAGPRAATSRPFGGEVEWTLPAGLIVRLPDSPFIKPAGAGVVCGLKNPRGLPGVTAVVLMDARPGERPDLNTCPIALALDAAFEQDPGVADAHRGTVSG